MRTLACVLVLGWLAFVSAAIAAAEPGVDSNRSYPTRSVHTLHPGRSIESIPAGLGEPLASAVNAYDDSAWIATDASLLVHIARDGSLIQGATLAGPASAVAVDLDESVWAVVGASLLHFSSQAEPLGARTMPFVPGERVTSLAADALRDRLWLGTSRALHRVGGDIGAIVEGEVTSLALDPRSGHVVAIVDGTLLSVVESEVRPLDALSIVDFELPLQVTYDASEGAFVVETTQRTWWIHAADVVLEYEHATGAPHFAVPFRIDPVIDLLRPPAGGVVTTATAEIVARVGALCNGIVCDVPSYLDRFHVEAILDGLRLPLARVDEDGIVRWPIRSGGDDASEFAAHAVDRFGHRASAHGRWTRPTPERGDTHLAETTAPPTIPSATVTKAANKLPTVTLTSPMAGAVFTLGNAISLTASAADPDGSVAKVEFYRGGTILIGTSIVAPFTASWASPIAGTHSLTAKAYDNRNGTATSAAVSIGVVANQSPSIALTTPATGALVPLGTSVSVGATATDADGRVASVQFFDGPTSLGVVSTAPFQISWTPSTPGLHVLHARAVDDKGAATDSRNVEVTVGSPPVVVVTTPLACSSIDGPRDVYLGADAFSASGRIVRVDYYDNDVLVASQSTPPWRVLVPNMQLGTHSIVARVADERGLTATSRPAPMTVRSPNQPPSVSLIEPANGAHVRVGSRVDLSAIASDPDGTIAAVEFRLEYSYGPLVARVTSAPYTATWTPASTGNYTLVAIATDDRGASVPSSLVNVIVDANAPPTVGLTVTPPGPYFAPATLTLAANAADSDGTIAGVEFYANGVLIGSDSTAPYDMVWDAIQGGSYELTAKALDDGGASTVSAPTTVSVVAAPALTFTGGIGTATVDDDNVLVSGYVSAPANSAVTVNGVVTHIDDRGFFQANDVPLASGTNEIVAIVTTQDGQTVTESVMVESSGPGLFKVRAAPTEGLETLQVTFTLENPQNVPFKQVIFDLDGDGYPNLIAYPNQFSDGRLTAKATYPVGTWIATITFYDDQDRVLYRTRKSIVVLVPQLFQGNVRAIYDNMLLRLRAGNVSGALTAFTGSAYERYNDIFTQLQPDLATIVDRLGTVTEITFNLDMAELTLVRDGVDGPQKFMIYLIRSEDGIWRIDGM